MDDYVTHWKVEDFLRFRLFLTHEKIFLLTQLIQKQYPPLIGIFMSIIWKVSLRAHLILKKLK